MTGKDVFGTIAAIRAKAPLIHNITNLVVTNTTANALLAIGASPAMVEGADEVESFVRAAAALVINLGTMNPDRAAAMRLAASAAQAGRIPWIMDPVAVGALAYRTQIARDLMDRGPTVIRGNASEILALSVGSEGGKGVDSADPAEAAIQSARALARRTGAAIAATGATDYVTDGTRLAAIANGHPMMTRVTGLGCTATAIIGACLAVQSDALIAAAHGLAIIGVAGELAAERARGPGSLQLELLDALYNLDQQTLISRSRITLS